MCRTTCKFGLVLGGWVLGVGCWVSESRGYRRNRWTDLAEILEVGGHGQ